MPLPRLYTHFAAWWPLLSAPEDYAAEAGLYWRLLLEAGIRPMTTALELGSGGGNNASHLKAHLEMTLADRSPAMLDVSRALNPECDHLHGDMRSLRLGRRFDAVLVFDAISYLTTEGELLLAMETAYAHCRPGGAALFAPDFVAERYSDGTEHGGHDGPGRALRYLQWRWDPDRDDTSYVADYVYLLREAGEPLRVEQDQHVLGLFPRATWLRLLEETGFEPAAHTFRHSELADELEVFLARRPQAS